MDSGNIDSQFKFLILLTYTTNQNITFLVRQNRLTIFGGELPLVHSIYCINIT